MRFIPYIFLFLFFIRCQKPDDPKIISKASTTEQWLVPEDDVLKYNTEKDRIQSIDHPEFIPIYESNLKPNDLVLVAHIGDETKLYPISILDAHEIVNDKINDVYFSVIYCPLTASGMLWNREIEGEVTEFGVSGMLYNRNLMPYDRKSESIWSQMEMKCVNGSLIGSIPETYTLFETKFSTIKTAFPNARVLTHSDCESGICEDIKTGKLLKNDPIENEDVTLPSDQNYYGIVNNDRLLLFNLNLFEDGVQVFTTNFRGLSLIVCGNKDLHFYTAFLKNTSGLIYIYSPVQNEFPVIMKDDRGNKYDVFGRVVAGPEKGKHLENVTAYLARTFAWELFYNNIEIYNTTN